MRILGYEWLKLINKRIFWVLIILLFLVNAGFYYQQQSRGSSPLLSYQPLYVQEMTKLTKESPDAAIQQLQKRLGENIKRSALLYADPDPEEPVTAELDRLRGEWLVLDLLHSQYQAIIQHQDFVRGLPEKARQLLSVSIFQQQDSFALRNIEQTLTAFEAVRDLHLTVDRDTGVLTGTQYALSDLVIMLALFIVCIYLFVYEKEKKLLRLLLATKNGRVVIVSTKLLVLTLATVLLALLFYGSILLLAYFFYGFGDLGRYIQSMNAFKQSHLPLTVFDYLLLYVVGKTLFSLIFAYSLACIFVICTHMGHIYVITATWLGSSFVLYKLIHPDSYINIFKYLNIFAFADTFQRLSRYQNIQLNAYPINHLTLSLLFIILLVLVLPTLLVWGFVGKRRETEQQEGFVFIKRLLPSLQGKWLMHNTWVQELSKSLKLGKIQLILLAGLAIGLSFVEWEEVRFTEENAIYNRYVVEFGGVLTKEKQHLIEEERIKLEAVPEKQAELYQALISGNLTVEAYNEQQHQWTVLGLQQKALNRILSQYNYLMELKENRQIEGRLVNEWTGEYLFGDGFHSILRAILFVLLIITTCSPSFAYEMNNGILPVLQSTKNGHAKLFIAKHLVAYLWTSTLYMLLFAPTYLNAHQWFGRMDWDAPVQSIRQFSLLSHHMSIGQFVAATLMYQLLGSFVIATIILCLSQLLKKTSLVILAASLLILCPLLVHLLGFQQLQSYSLHYIYFVYQEIALNGIGLHFWAFTAIMVAMGILAGYIGWRSFQHKRLF